jgi:hypothetical protein
MVHNSTGACCELFLSLGARLTSQKSKLHNLQYDEGGNHMAEAETYFFSSSRGKNKS